MLCWIANARAVLSEQLSNVSPAGPMDEVTDSTSSTIQATGQLNHSVSEYVVHRFEFGPALSDHELKLTSPHLNIAPRHPVGTDERPRNT